MSLLMVTTSCCSKFCSEDETIEIPCDWHTPIERGMTLEDPACFRWWEAFDDYLLIALIEKAAAKNKDVRLAASVSKENLLEVVNTVAAEIARNYIELRGLQARSEIFEESIEAEDRVLALNDGLSTKGLYSLIEQNESKKNLEALLVQKSQIELGIKKTIFHLSVLVGDPPDSLFESLNLHQKLPEIPTEFPVGLPMELVERNPTIRTSKKVYDSSHNKQAYFSYQKTILNVLEEAEKAITTFQFELDKVGYLNNTRELKNKSHILIRDLYEQGLKDDRDLLRAYQEVLFEDNLFIQSQVELLNSYVNIYQVLGTGWEIQCVN